MLLLLYLLHQTLFVVAERYPYKYTIQRVLLSGKKYGYDGVLLPNRRCQRENDACKRFHANLGSPQSTCLCLCSSYDAATFGVKNGLWRCVDNKEIRERELQGKSGCSGAALSQGYSIATDFIWMATFWEFTHRLIS